MTGQQLKNSILQLAIEGRLVAQCPTDEPASALLQRIRQEKQALVKAGTLKKKDLTTTPITDDEKPFDIPESWEWCRLGDIGSWGSGATPAKGKPEYYTNGNIPWLRTGELNNSYVYDSEIKVTQAALDNCSLRMCQKGDVLIAMYGATIGKVAIAGIQLTTNQACCACTPIFIYNEFLMWYLIASKPAFIKLGEGGAQPNISREKIVAFPLALPPLAEQRRIVARIEELMPLVEQYGKAQGELEALNAGLPEALKKSILQEAIQGRLVPQCATDEPASALLQRIRREKEQLVKAGTLKKKDLTTTPITDDEKPFDIPEGWEWCRLEDILEFVNGRAYKKEELLPSGKYKVLRVGNFFTNESWYYSNLELEETKYCHKGDLLYAWSASFGPHIWEGDKTIFHYHIWNVRYSKENLYREYLYYFFLNDVNIIRKSTTGSTMVHVSMENMKPRLIPLPPLAEQRRIVAKIEELFALL